MKRIFTLLIIATMFAISSLAYDVQIDGIYYNLNDETKTAEVTSTSSYNTYSGDITIPEKITYNATEYSVTSIGNDAFYWSSSLTSITIPNSVTSIGIYAFYDCSSLTSITIPNSVTSIGDGAFEDCSSLTSITIPNSVTSIGGSAFQYCSSLTSITIPNSVTSIGRYAFSGTPWLNNQPNGCVYINNYLYKYKGEMPTNTHIEVNEGTTMICGAAFESCKSLASITIPNSVTSIGEGAFYLCSSLTSISIGNSVTSIGSSAFSGCSSLTSITIPNSVTSIGNYAFSNCSGLTSINIEATIPPTIGEANTFNNVSKNIPVTVPCGSLSAYQSANYWSEFTNYVEEFPYTFSATTADATMGSVTIETAPACGVDAVIKATPNDDYRFVKWSDGNTENPRTITVAEDITLTAEFANDIIASGTCGDNLTWQLTYDSVLTISGTGNMYDYNSSDQPWNSYKQQIKTININDGVTSIGDWAFSYCRALRSITISNSVTSIGGSAFYDCDALTSITIPNSVTSIGSSAFSFCSSLTSITIPNSVTSIGEYAFLGCSRLTSIEVNADNPNYTSIGGVLYNKDVTTLICCPGGKTSITIPNSVTEIGEKAFYYCSSLASITIPNSVTYIGDWTFSYCSSLTSITIPNSVTYIGNNAFSSCSSLTSITIPNSVTSIGNSAFSNCSKITEVHISNIAKWCDINFSSLASNPLCSKKAYLYVNNSKITDLVIPEGVDSIKNNAFTGYALLNSVTIPNSIIIIGDDAFRDCYNLISVTIPNSVTSIGNYAFYYCLSLTSITIPNSVTSIGERAFYWCSSLTSITIPNSVTSIGDYAFSNCSGLTSINIEATIPPTIGEANTFNNVSKNIPVTVPCGSLSAYQSANYWSEFTNYVEEFPYTFSATTADATMGSVTIETAPACGVDAVIKATPNDDYRFVKWSDGNTENPRTITVAEDITLTAIFEVIKFHVSVTCNNPAMGMVLFTSGTNDTDYEKGATVSFVAITNSGYLFNGWSDGVKDVFRTIVITQDTTITALFGSNTCSLTLNTDAIMGSVTGSGTYTKGTTATIIATPNDGYRFVKWSDGNTNATRSIIINEDMTLSAIFEKIPTFTISVTANAQMGSATGGGTFETGKTTTLSAIANEGYHFVKWSDGITTNPRTITVTQNISLEAIFEALYVNWTPDNNSNEHSFIGKHYYDTVTITAGKTLIIEDKATIACNDIVIKADKNGNVPDIKVEGDIIANNGVTYEWQIDDTRWYFFSLPFNCKIQDITLSTIANGPNDGVWNYYNPNDGSGDFIIRKYNQKNASNGQGKKTGWEDCKDNEMLYKGRGYIIGLFPSGSKAKAMFKSEKQELLSKLIDQELDFGDDHSWFDYQAGDNALYNGWNLIGVPYFEAFSQGELDVAYVSIPNSDGVTYKQYTLSEALSKGLLRPFMSFFIQLGENRAPIFSPNDRSNVPMLKTKENRVDDKIITSIRYVENKELSDKTTIINNVALTTEYEIGHDLQKMIGYAEQPQIYTIEECGILAFNAQDVSSRMSIRLGVYAPVDGEYVIGGEAWGDMADVMLYDNETYRSTSLIIPQTVYLEKGVHDERFEIRVQNVPTGTDNQIDNIEVVVVNGKLVVENMPENSNLYIYDMNGKLVHQQRTDTAIDYEFYAQGIYNIVICTDNNKVFNTKLAY